MTFTLITDSTADLDTKWALDHDVRVFGIPITVGNVSYQTIGKDALSSEALLKMMDSGAEVKTSQVSTGDFTAVFTQLAKDKKEVLYLALSSGLSGTYQSALIAREMVLEEVPEAQITVMDTLAVASGEGFLVEEAVKLRDAGKSLTASVDILSDLIKRLRSWFMVDDLYHLARGGRIPKSLAVVGSLASIKPILDVDAEGKLHQAEKVRSLKKAVSKLISHSLSDLDTAYPKIIVAFSGEDSEAQKIAALIKEDGRVTEVVVRLLGPVIVTHAGSGTLAIFAISQHSRQ